MGASDLRLSVIIATFNRGESVGRLMAQLDRQSLAPNEFEVIVVDDGSFTPVEPSLRRVAVSYAMSVVTQENAGPAAARHRGIMRARGDVLVLLDDDMIVDEEFLASHLAAHPDG